ncbi:hypothetical protein GCM10028858_27000 [Halorubrum pallidum]
MTRRPPPFGPQALGTTVFAHPAPDELDGVVARLRAGEATADDRARFVGVAVGSRPASLSADRDRAAAAAARVREADSWVGRAVREWRARAGERGAPVTIPVRDRDRLVRELEDDAGAPETTGWE